MRTLKRIIFLLIFPVFIASIGVNLYGILNPKDYQFVHNLLFPNEKAAGKSDRKPPYTIEDVEKFDVEGIIKVKNAEDAKRIRAELIEYIFKGDNHLTALPEKIEENKNPPKEYADLDYAKMETLSLEMEHGVLAEGFYTLHTNSNCLFIYNYGHGESHRRADYSGFELVKKVFDAGCDVITLSMPLIVNQPVVYVEGFGKLKMRNHNVFELIENDDFSPTKYFMKPISAFLNYALSKGNYRVVSVAGLSGGGWTANLYGAIDERVNLVFSLAGSSPVFIRNLPEIPWWDWEQINPKLYRIANYLDLYILNSFEGRESYQILNVYDTCCFRGTAGEAYGDIVASYAKNLGGKYELIYDHENNLHSISEKSANFVVETIKERRKAKHRENGK